MMDNAKHNLDYEIRQVQKTRERYDTRNDGMEVELRSNYK